MQKKSFTRVGYLVHLRKEGDDSIDLDLRHEVLRGLLAEASGIKVVKYLSYKDNPLVAQYFIDDLSRKGIDTIVVHDPKVFDEKVIKLFLESNFNFLLIEVNSLKTKYRFTNIPNCILKSSARIEKLRAESNWVRLNQKYKNALIHNEKMQVN
ncbi:hypothetical protein [Bacillus cereus]|uniref:hypothetical protein n=1 Tax=Bacillus cereus TaxID=1396 RepID=UPI001F35E3C4|nr:hypothetical protein [Bacillus cereus]BCB35585.1 hypothetical protein BCM0045_0480 [Bacillus cereus]BCB98394.1 hypothetical protein BCM0057_0477 [Bacillus cereus]BCC21887.1 hypothetical protein BCM0079_0480 [Bacillus cereus]BCC33498.1 hypothetical protein BCM0105_0488 [Bacillus cereus]